MGKDAYYDSSAMEGTREHIEEKREKDILSGATDQTIGVQEEESRIEDQTIETVYVRNLNDKVSVNRLKDELEKVFRPFGKIIQITAHKNLKMKGQAFITYANKEASRAAIEGLNEYEMFGKAMHVAYARSNSDNYHHDILKNYDAVEMRKQIKATANKQASDESKVSKPRVKKMGSWKAIPPNKILLIQNLKPEIVNGDLLEFFEAYGGFINSRLVKVRNLSFIEFENEASATSCLDNLTKEKLAQFGSDALVTYAKK